MHNQAIAREYLGREDGVLFFDKPPDINEQWQAYDELLEEDAFLINNYLARYFSKTMDSIVLGIRKALEGKERGGQIAALHLLPGIPLQGLEASLLSTLRSLIKAHQDKSDQINKIYDSVTWKTGDLISRVFRKMPDAVKKLIYRGSN